MTIAAKKLFSGVSEYLTRNASYGTNEQIFFLSPDFWTELRKLRKVEKLDKRAQHMKKLRRFVGTVDLFNKEIVFILIADTMSWSVLALFNLRCFGKTIMSVEGKEGLGAVLFSKAEPKKEFLELLGSLNNFLTNLHYQQFNDKQLDGNLTKKCLFHSVINSTIETGMEQIFSHIKKVFKVNLKKSQEVQCPKCNSSVLKANRCPGCKAPPVNPDAKVNGSVQLENDSSQDPPEDPAPVAAESVKFKIRVDPPKMPEIERLRKCMSLKLRRRREATPPPPPEESSVENSQGLSPEKKLKGPEPTENCNSQDLDLERAQSMSPKQDAQDEQEESAIDTNLHTLSDDDDETMDSEDCDDIFYISKSGERFPFSKTDLQTLRPHEWLNDSVLNFYLQYLLDHSSEDVQKRVCLFSSYFYQRLNVDYANSQASKKNCIRPWKHQVGVLDREYLAFPVNENDHWYLVIVKIPPVDKVRQAKVVVYAMNSMLDEDDDYDPLSEKLKMYIGTEYKTKHGRPMPLAGNKKLDLRVPEVPQQKNGSDCGLFVLEYFEQFLKVLEQDQSISDINFKKWFLSSALSKKRQFLTKLIMSFKKTPADTSTNGNGLRSSPRLMKRKKGSKAFASPAKKFSVVTTRSTRRSAMGN